MAYIINRTDGSIFATIADGTINTDSSVTLVGRNYTDYGEAIAENFLRLLENSADSSPPANPLSGELWFDTSTNTLKVFNGSTFKSLSGATVSADEPIEKSIGDLWFDTNNSQLFVWDGTEFNLIGPQVSQSAGKSGNVLNTITDDNGIDHVVVEMYVANELVNIYSVDSEFTPATPIPGFSTIKPGVNLSSDINGNTPIFNGDASNSLRLEGQPASNFLSSINSDSTTGSLSILNDGGLSVGASNDLSLTVVGQNVYIRSVTPSNNIKFQVHNGITVVEPLTLRGDTGRATTLEPVDLQDITTKNYVDNTIVSEINSQKGVPNGLASLDPSGLIYQTQLPKIAITNTYVVSDEPSMLALTAETGDVAIRTDLSKSFILAGTDPSILSDWEEMLTPVDAVQSVGGYTGTVTSSDLLTAIKTVDGSGSGLDADTLDGYDSSYFYSPSNPQPLPPSGTEVFTSNGTFVVPAGVTVITVTGVGGGQGGQGGGDGGSCGAGGNPARGGTTSIVGSQDALYFSGGRAVISGTGAVSPDTITTKVYRIKNSYTVNLSNLAFGNAGERRDTTYGNPERGGHGGDSLFAPGGRGGTPGYYTTANPGSLGSGGAGNQGQDSLAGAGGHSGWAGVGIPMFVTPGEVLTITIGTGSPGTSGCRSTGGKGGDGLVIISY